MLPRLLLPFVLCSATPVFSVPAEEVPVFSELSLVASRGTEWLVPVGTRLYGSEDGHRWKRLLTAPSRIRFLDSRGDRAGAAGRDWITLFDNQGAAVTLTLETDLTSFALVDDGWLATDAQGALWSGFGAKPASRQEVAKDVKLTHLALTHSGTEVLAGIRQKQGVLFERNSRAGVWVEAKLETNAVVVQLASDGSDVLAILSDGRVARRSVAGEWTIAAEKAFQGEAPTALLASARYGFFAVLGDGVTHSWDGRAWFRLSYHDFNDEKRVLVLSASGPTYVFTGDDPRTPSLETAPVTLWVDSERPAKTAIDVLSPESSAPAIAAWDAEVADNPSPDGKLEATERLLRFLSKKKAAGSASEQGSLARRLVERLSPYLSQPAQRARLTHVLKEDLNVSIEIGAPAELAEPETAPREAPLFPSLGSLNDLRNEAAAGRLASMVDLGISYLQGAGVQPDRFAAAFWFDWAHQSLAEIPSLDSLEAGEVGLPTLERLAKLGSIWANVLVADHYREGLDTELDITQAAKGYRYAAQRGSIDALTALGECYLNGWGVDASPEAAVALFVEPAKARNPAALFNMGRCFEMGAGLSPNPSRAAECFLQAVQLGDRKAARKIADLLLAGRGVSKDEVRARAFLQRAAEDGDKEAARRLEALEKGGYTPAPPETLASHRRQPAAFPVQTRETAAKGGDPAAAWDLAQAHAAGFGMYPNQKYAVAWLLRARAAGLPENLAQASDRLNEKELEQLSELGSAFAPYVLGSRRHEAGGDESRSDSLRWFEIAAQRGNPQAQASLGRLLLDGGRKEDEKQGVSLLESAVSNGNPEAMSALASLCATGVHVGLNHARALSLHRQAAALGYRPSQVDLAFLVATKQLRGAPPEEAARWFLTLAGIPNKLVSPETAAQIIETQARAGNAAARGVFAVLNRIGFGVPANPDAATAWSLLADEEKANFYSLVWYSEGANLERAKAFANRLRTQQDATLDEQP